MSECIFSNIFVIVPDKGVMRFEVPVLHPNPPVLVTPKPSRLRETQREPITRTSSIEEMVKEMAKEIDEGKAIGNGQKNG